MPSIVEISTEKGRIRDAQHVTYDGVEYQVYNIRSTEDLHLAPTEDGEFIDVKVSDPKFKT